MASHLFFFGRSPELSLTELSVFVPGCTPVFPGIVEASSVDFSINGVSLTPKAFIAELGGIVRIAEVIGRVADVTSETLASLIAPYAVNGKVVFGVAVYPDVPGSMAGFSAEIKKALEAKDVRSRYVERQPGDGIPSVAVEKEQCVEISVIREGDRFLVARTVAVQAFEAWSRRDYGRPYADSKAGMLPPKASRMAVNIALGATAKGKTLLDPFCGMGTVLGEAVIRGAIAMGSDTDEKAVEKAKRNLVWLRSFYPDALPVTLFTADATHISENVAEHSIDAIVTEPFMGTPKLGEGRLTDPKAIEDVVKGLDKLYIGCLKDWKSVLKPGGVVLMAFPRYEIGKRTYNVKKAIDSCEMLGYTKLLGPLTYSRPQAVVHRDFYLFTVNT